MNVLIQENKRIKEQFKIGEHSSTARGKTLCNCMLSNNAEALSCLTKKLQEISSTYDDVRRDMKKLQEVSRMHLELRKEIS